MEKTKLQIMREKKNLTIRQLAEKAAWCQEKKQPSIGVILHFENSIRKLEGENVVAPKPRKTYEYRNIAQALGCSVEELIEV
ncbi:MULTISPECIES: helix-turn-helix domain-containing protein [Lactococcus]|jgi:transcriptional regulator with XRE-family HTH domain|uniref:Helix-turn-helix transcriptional regulator n=1 Tax=Lactococcus formosensis TaxID=1281486 RepID=A0A9Q8Y313_9LACT|nr:MULTISPECIES: helix-turn-helix transcriptional regulator [Lactococcus]USI66507.1 helix-turn-helix transcriptional regulator [Lactococcus petauri]USI68950.1 helix-turn-helix transcriptional regulator [Lactococcus petauri]USJ21137.1 helix-turn-helix transcriptional regulator [Lactococcus formosensis]WJE13618.1 helix-turn-helix transcriptional regulator [Lactococcus petauri]